ncbi:MAG: SDR family oxidoreductase [Pseudomonadota bacterium]
MRLKDKTAIVTGGASGFGEGIARRFAAEGAKVMIADLNADGAVSLAREIGGSARALKTDVSRKPDVEALIAETISAFGGIDILINNAGTTHTRAHLEDVPEDEFDRVFAVNCKSVYYTSQAVIPHMKARGTGAVLNVSSTAGISPRAMLNWYNASKGWMNTATKTMAVELAPFGIRVNAINPVAGETPLLGKFLGEDTPDMRAKFLATIPLGRFSTPDDMANAALYLCSDEASMVTGVCMEVDGGRCI